jgi:hypothetical protein
MLGNRRAPVEGKVVAAPRHSAGGGDAGGKYQYLNIYGIHC